MSYPTRLTGENCQLLLPVRNTVLMENSAERVVASTQEWNEWENVLEWGLMSEVAILRNPERMSKLRRQGSAQPVEVFTVLQDSKIYMC
jgi:hypothetical protein